MSIENGWMEGIEHIPTAAPGIGSVTPGTMWPKQIVHHVMQGYQGTMIQWAQERPPVQQNSVHFTVGRDGRAVQHRSIWDPCRHVGWQNWNAHSVGIEQEGFSVPPGYGYDFLYGPANPWPEALIASVIRIDQWCFEAIRRYDQTVVPGPDTIIGHSSTGQPDRVDDPGAYWFATVQPRILAAFAPPGPDLAGALNDLRTAMDATAAAIVKLGG